jgi:hypothetical protein
MTWINNTEPELTDDARRTFTEAREAVLGSAFAAPPRERDGCPTCPARCRVLPFVAAYQPSLQASVQGQLAKNGTASDTAAALDREVAGGDGSGSLIPLLARRPENARLRRDWLYCLVVNTTFGPPVDTAAAERRAATLSVLRGDAPPSAAANAAASVMAAPESDPLRTWRAKLTDETTA